MLAAHVRGHTLSLEDLTFFRESTAIQILAQLQSLRARMILNPLQGIKVNDSLQKNSYIITGRRLALLSNFRSLFGLCWTCVTSLPVVCLGFWLPRVLADFFSRQISCTPTCCPAHHEQDLQARRRGYLFLSQCEDFACGGSSLSP